MEDSLDLLSVEYDPLGLATFIFVVEGDGFPGSCARQQRLYKPWKLVCSHVSKTVTASTQLIRLRREGPLTVDGDAGLRFVVLAGNLPDVEGLGGRFGQQAEHEDDGVRVRKAIRVDVSAQRETEAVSYYSASSSQKRPT